MRKRLLASIMAMVLLPSLFPVSALAVERDKGSETPVACAVTEGCTLQAGHECECVLPDEPETTEDDPAPADNVMSGNCGLYDYINKEYTDTVNGHLQRTMRMVILSQFSVMVLWEMLISRKTM